MFSGREQRRQSRGSASCTFLINRAQGLELGAVLLASGTDFMREARRWSNARARGYKRAAHVRDPFQLRLNAYRALLTRGRDATVAFVAPVPELDETYRYLCASGFRFLE